MRSLNALAAVASILLLLTGCERAKTKLDREVDRLCAIDGGLHIYETVSLSSENFGPSGEVFPQYRSKQMLVNDDIGEGYKWKTIKINIIEGDPSLTRWEQVIFRVKDEKVLGRRVVYIRGGGDFPGSWSKSQYSCLDVPLGLMQHIFLKRNSK